MEFSTLLSRFGSVGEHSDGGFLALCPAHNDSDPSLRIWVGEDRKVRLTCRAGCDTNIVRVAADLQWPDLFDVTGDVPTVPTERPALVGVRETASLQNYIDIAGQNLRGSGSANADSAADYAANRFGIVPSMFEDLELGLSDDDTRATLPYLSRSFLAYPRLLVPLCSFDGVVHGLQGRDITGDCPGRWLSLSNPRGHRWGQYGVFRGRGGHGVVIVTEGPGDGLTAVSVGYDVVFIRGAGLVGNPELLAELADGLRGHRVIAAGDNDESGLRFNRMLADGLRPHGIDVYELRIPDLGPKTDVTDWRTNAPEVFAAQLHAAVHNARIIKPKETPPVAITGTIVERRDDAVTKEMGLEAARILDEMEDRYTESDAANAHALAEWSGRIRYSGALGFYVWNGKAWEPSNNKLRHQIHTMGAALALAGKTRQAKAFVTTRRIDEMTKELKSVPGVYTDADAFDRNHDILAFNNGVVDLRTGKLREHRKEDLNTSVLSVDYDPDAQCPRWEQFLKEIMPGTPDMPTYLQRLVGYGITGRTSEQCFAVLHGKGANGKSVFIDAITKIFAEITEDTPFSTFEEKSSGGIPNDIAKLRDARLVSSNEGESGKPMAEAVLKRATGGDDMTARFLQKEFFTFTPKFLILMATNHEPQFRGQDEGLWRRVKMIPFTRFFRPEEREDKTVMDRRFQVEEAAGIAAWAVRGAVEWYRGGLQDPDVVRGATSNFRETSNTLDGFCPGIVEVTKNPNDVVPGSDLFTAYMEWAQAENLPTKEQWRRTTFYRAMTERGAERKKLANGINLVGIRMCHDNAPVGTAAGPGIFAQ